jgi:hypothetical protein
MTTTYYRTPDGDTLTFEQPDPPRSPLDAVGASMTLLVVLGVVPIGDAANAVGLSPDDLVAEAEAWAAAVEFSGVDE